MGLILDTGILIDAERQKRLVLYAVEHAFSRTAEVDLAISTITLMELAYGMARAREVSTVQLRQQFLTDVQFRIPAYPVTQEIAIRAGLLDGELESQGITVDLADLLIGVTALHHGHGVLTSNIRHFRAIPGLEVVHL